MKIKMSIIVTILFLFSCKTTNNVGLDKEMVKCSINKTEVNRFISFLNKVIPEYHEKWGESFLFDNENCFAKRLTIHDLTNDPVVDLYHEDFKFRKGHVYYFYCLDDNYAFSHFAYINDNGNITFFESINCKDRGDSFQDVLNFLTQKLDDNPKKKDIIKRVKNYRTYYISGSIDGIKVPLKCDCDSC